jgi:hypothetical protein
MQRKTKGTKKQGEIKTKRVMHNAQPYKSIIQ